MEDNSEQKLNRIVIKTIDELFDNPNCINETIDELFDNPNCINETINETELIIRKIQFDFNILDETYQKIIDHYPSAKIKLKFYDCEFKGKVFINDSIKELLGFYDSIFCHHVVTYDNSKVINTKKIIFRKSIFKRRVNFSNTQIGDATKGLLTGRLSFDESIFSSRVNFMYAKFNVKNISFTDAIFKGEVFFNNIQIGDIEQGLLTEEFSFNNSTFEEHIDFRCSTLNVEVADFKDCKFKKNVILDESIIKTIEFKDSTFEEKLSCQKVKINSLKTTACIFNGNLILDQSTIKTINIEDSTFNGKISFINGRVDILSFSNCVFNQTTKIVNITGIRVMDSVSRISRVSFKRCIISAKFFFNGWEDSIIYLKQGIDVIFSHIYLEEQGYMIFRNINNVGESGGNLKFDYANILGAITIQDSHFESLNLDNSTIVGVISIVNSEPLRYSSYKTLTKLKSNAIKENDNILALAYKSEEMRYYFEEFKSDYKWLQNISRNMNKHKLYMMYGIISLPFLLIVSIIPVKRRENYATFTLLFLNRISNSFGQSWGIGVMFTMIVAFLFFCLINYFGVKHQLFEIGFTSWESYGDVWKDYLQILNIVSFKELDFGFDTFGATLFFISKIFVGYGIYQTISAFRKYGK